MKLAIIVAASENGVIGEGNQMPWHIGSDLRRFRQLTTGHTVIMGRKTYESIGKALPNRRNIVITRNVGFQAPDCEIATSIESALAMAKSDASAFIIGGGSIYNSLWDRVDELFLTRVHTCIDRGDTFIPLVDETKWRKLSEERFEADEKNDYPYSFINYQRI